MAFELKQVMRFSQGKDFRKCVGSSDQMKLFILKLGCVSKGNWFHPKSICYTSFPGWGIECSANLFLMGGLLCVLSDD